MGSLLMTLTTKKFIFNTSSATRIMTVLDDNDDNDLFGTKASAAAEAVLGRDAFLDKPFFLVDDHWPTSRC